VSRNGGEDGEENRPLRVRVEPSPGPEPGCRFCPPAAAARGLAPVALSTLARTGVTDVDTQPPTALGMPVAPVADAAPTTGWGMR
jgi:hypothetical protein